MDAGTGSCSTRHATKDTWMFCIKVTLFLLLVQLASSVPTTERTVPQGATVTQPVLNVSLLDKNDQLMTYYRGELCGQYFCRNGTCNNEPDLESRFQVYSGNLCLIIPNINVSNSGQYSVVLNGYKDVLNLTLHVEGFREGPQRSIFSWLVPVIIAVAVIAVGLIFVIRLIYKKFCSGSQKTETAALKELPYI